MTDVVTILGAELVAEIERGNNLRMLAAASVEVAGDPAGWRVEIGGRIIIGHDIDTVIARALAVLRGRRDLWPTIPEGVLRGAAG
jgi:uncharacterized membrane protein YdfJ with MMPL/SSD domain